MNFRKHRLLARISSEGYCCLKGYLELCQARGETAEDMAKNIGLSPDAIWYNYRKLREGKLQCQGRKDCLGPTIQEIKLLPPRKP